ncbi:transcriptional regulator [Halobacteriales archaeon QS_8_69_26]|nr:MAG: transcriptional regulator [Halobacteriales archaeon QS_8_69_26]
MALFDSDVPIREVVTTDPETAKALENDLRAKVLDALADEELTVGEIRAELERRGDPRAETTVRHHLNVLREADLVEVARLEEAGGGTRKYYASNTRVFSYDLPEGSEERLAEARATVTGELGELVATLYDDHGDAIEAVAREMRPCEYCETQHYEEFVVRELLDDALVELGESGVLDDAD